MKENEEVTLGLIYETLTKIGVDPNVVLDAWLENPEKTIQQFQELTDKGDKTKPDDDVFMYVDGDHLVIKDSSQRELEVPIKSVMAMIASRDNESLIEELTEEEMFIEMFIEEEDQLTIEEYFVGKAFTFRQLWDYDVEEDIEIKRVEFEGEIVDLIYSRDQDAPLLDTDEKFIKMFREETGFEEASFTEIGAMRNGALRIAVYGW